MAREFARGDLVNVPVWFGGDTWTKILEAFAHRIPVISASTGCEGSDVLDGQHLLAEDPDGLATCPGSKGQQQTENVALRGTGMTTRTRRMC